MGRVGRAAITAAALASFSLGGTAAAKEATPIWTELPRGGVQEATTSGLPNLSELVKQASPAVVSIIVEEASPADLPPSDPLHDFFDRFYGDQPNEGLGTGFVIRSDGLILTNSHVVESAKRIRVVLEDQGFPHEYEARVVGKDSATDLALLRVKADHELPVLPLGDSDGVEIADWVVAIGNPFGLAQSVTFGIVSQVGRTDITPQGREGYFDFIQTDASINPGNSGGPLLNLRGEVVAINNAINASGQGIGFAVPINMAKRVIPALEKHGKVERAWVGMSIQDVTVEFARSMGLQRPAGAVVSELEDGGPAAKAGLKVGDVIVGFEGKPVSGAHKLRWEVACGKAGQKVALDVLRDGKIRKLDVELGKQPNKTRAATSKRATDKLGFVTDETDEAARLASGSPGGAPVVAVMPHSRAARAGLMSGDLVVGLGDEPVVTAADLASRLDGLPSGTLVEFLLLRDGTRAYVAMRLP